jgi:hypothetical protein
MALILAGCSSSAGVRFVGDAAPASHLDAGALVDGSLGVEAQVVAVVAPDTAAASSDALPVVVADAMALAAPDTLPAATPDAWVPTPDVYQAAATTPDALATPDPVTPDAWSASDGPIDPPPTCQLLQVKTSSAQEDFCPGYWPSSPPLLCSTLCFTLDSAHPRMVYDDPAKGCYSQRVMTGGNTQYVVCLPSADLCAKYCPKK